jgi:hypothetical protein
MKTIFLLFTSLLISVSVCSQTDLDKLSAINLEFYWIDNSVLLMEEISDLSLKSSLKEIEDLAGKNPSYKIPLTDMRNRLIRINTDNANENMIFGKIVSTYLNHEKLRLPTFSNSGYTDCIHQLYHHTQRLFEYRVGDGKVFDENLVSIFYHFRNQFRQFIENEKMKHELKQQIAVLQTEISVICDSIISVKILAKKNHDSLKTISGSTQKLTEDQQRDERVSQLVTRRKWRYLAATKLSKQQLDGITYGKDRKAARKELKKAVK